MPAPFLLGYKVSPAGGCHLCSGKYLPYNVQSLFLFD